MAITVATLPEDRFRFSRIPLNVEVSSDMLVQTAGVYYTRTISFINAPTTDAVVFEITWNGITVTMESMASPITEDGTRYRKKTGGESVATWVQHFAEDVSMNFEISRDFIITYSGTDITFTARIAETSTYNITFNDIPGTGAGIDYTLGAATVGVTEVLRDNFHIFMDVYFDNDDYVRMDMVRTDKSSTGYYEAQIQRVIHERIQSPFPLRYDDDDIVVLTNGDLLIKYWLRFFEFYGTTAEPAAFYYLRNNSAAFYYLLMGGHYMDKNHTFLLTNATTLQFLTFQKRTKYVTEDQPEWLYWMVHSDGELGRLLVTIHYTDETTDEVDFTWSETDPIVMYKEVGYYQVIADNADPLKTVSHWTVMIDPDDDAEPLMGGETFTYYLMTEGTPWTKFFLFRNSFGAYDTMRNVGVESTGLDITGEIMNRWLDHDYYESDGQFENNEFSNIVVHSAVVGFEEEEAMIDYLRELFVYPKAAIAQYDPDAAVPNYRTIFIPIVIDPASIKIKKSNDMLYTLEFDYKEAYFDTGIVEVVS